MGANSNCCDNDTIPIPIMDPERKTIPVICPRCNVITGVVERDVKRNKKISPVYDICCRTDKCKEGGISD